MDPAAEGLQVDDRVARAQQEKIPALPITEPSQKAYDDRGEGMEVAPNETAKRYCGLRPKVFWIVLGVVLLVIIGGAVGGGVGGSLAGKSANESSGPSTPTPTPTTPLPISSSTSSTPTTSTSSSSSSSTVSASATACPAITRNCNNTTCNGRNNPIVGVPGICEDRCPCISICGAINGPCSNCGGKNDPSTGVGTCFTGGARGCNCASICGATNGPCDQNGCFGNEGVCSAGNAWGCNCG